MPFFYTFCLRSRDQHYPLGDEPLRRVSLIHYDRISCLSRKVEKDIEVTRSVAEEPEQQRNLSSMMNTMSGRVLHQLS